MNIIVLTAHTDDIENGMGGTMTLLAKAGHNIFSIIVTLPRDRAQANIRVDESARSHRLLGVTPVFLAQPDGEFFVSKFLRSMVKTEFDACNLDAVFTLWPADVHPDHRAVADLAMGLCLARGVNTELLCFEVCSSGRSTTAFRPQSLGFFPTHYVDTTSVQVEKKALMDCQVSQDPEGMWAGMRNVHANRGREAGCDYAEGFVRLTRCGPIHPELAPLFVPSNHVLPRGIGVDFLPETIGVTL